MASKLMVNSALGARLLLRPSQQRPLSFGIIYKLGCPITGQPMWPLVLGSKAYSRSSPTRPLPKPQSSQSSSRRNKDGFSKNRGQIFPRLKGGAKFLAVSGMGIVLYVIQYFWFPGWYKNAWRDWRESVRESTILEKLKKGPKFPRDIEAAIPRESLVEEVKMLITATERSQLYPVIIGEHGTGKTTLIRLAIKGMDKDKPKGIAYVNLPVECDTEADIATAIQEGLGWDSDPALDSDKPTSVRGTLKFFSRVALKYEQKHKQVPVLIIDNVNRLSKNKQEFLNLLQDYAKHASDEGIATVVFVSSEGRVPRRMSERSAWSRSGEIIEVDDMSKEEALQFLKLRGLNEEQATQGYELVGGRIMHLKGIADGIRNGRTLQAIRQKMFNKAKGQLENANLFPQHGYYKEGAVVIRKLLKEGSISDKTYYGLVGVGLGKELLETNVFAFHLSSQEIFFQSTVMKRFCEENSALWGGK